ncbi:MAG: M23 family metallopeptidase [Defluviitaleaceae bacterium]|nr:M23 family metallopeptidase [Defluviitaleaceae bacterium]
MKNVSGPENSVFRKKGFFIALYSCLGVVAILAVVVTFANRGITSPYEDEPTVYVGADGVESYLAQAQEEAWFRPRQTPPPEPAPTPPPAQPQQRTQPRQAPEPPQIETPEPTAPEPAPPAPPPAPTVETFEPFTADAGMVWPLYGEVVMPFSDTHIWNTTFERWSTNDNLQIAAREGDPVRAGADGRVVAIGNNDFWQGNYVTIDHGDGWVSTLGQLMENVLVNEGDVVRAGEVIGGVGLPSIGSARSGTHARLQITHNDSLVNPYDLLQER